MAGNVTGVTDANGNLNEDGYNWYVYGNQNPVRYIDPSGESYAATWGSSAWWLTGTDGPLPVGDAIYIGGIVIGVIVDGVTILYFKEHTSNKRKSNWDKHTKRRSGDKSKAQDKPGWVDRSNKKKK